MAVLQKPLRGWSDFIGRFTAGAVRLQDVEVVTPQLDISDFINERKNQAFTTTFTAGGQFASLTIPDGKRWRIHFAGFTFNSAPTQQADMSVMYRKNFGAAAFFGYLGDRQTTLSSVPSYQGNQGEAIGSGFSNVNLILDPGDEVGVICNDIAAAGNYVTDFMVQYQEWAI